jgi:archaeosortase A (PGF-CTERM-specific)
MWFVGEIVLFLSIALLGIGYFWKERRTHIVRGVGWVLFGLFWAFQAPYYIMTGDIINSIATCGALFAFSYLGYHEYLSYKWNEEYEPLRFFAGATFLASLIYFAIERFPLVSGGLIKIVADQSAWLTNLAGNSYVAGPIDFAGNSIFYKTTFNEVHVPIMNANINIILACTGIHAIAVTLSVAACTRAPTNKRLRALGILLPTIYIVNLVRNAIIIHFYSSAGWDFDFLHGTIGKGISLFTLFILILVVFLILPELYDNINGIFELPWRKGPGHDHKKHIGRVMNRLMKQK